MEKKTKNELKIVLIAIFAIGVFFLAPISFFITMNFMRQEKIISTLISMLAYGFLAFTSIFLMIRHEGEFKVSENGKIKSRKDI